MANVEEPIKKAKMLGEFALMYHPFHQRKMEAVKVTNVTILSDIILSRTAKGK